MRSDGMDRRLAPIVGLIVCCGLVTVAWAVSGIEAPPSRPALYYPVVLASLVAVASGCTVPIRTRTPQGISSTSAAVLVSVAVLPTHWVVVCTAVGVGVGRSVVGSAPAKVAFAAAKESIAALAAALTAGWIGLTPVLGSTGHLADSWPTTVVALCAAALVYAVVDETVPVPVVALADRTPWRRVVQRGARVRAGVKAATLVLALATVLVTAIDARLLVATPLAVLLLHSGYRRRLHLGEERSAWRQLAETTDALNTVDLDVVLRTAIDGAARLFSARLVEIEFQYAGQRRLIRGDEHGLRYDGPAGAGGPPSAGEPVTVPLGAIGPEPTGPGVLRLVLPTAGLSDRERYTLRTFGAALTTAIRNAIAYAQATELAARHEHDATHDPLTGLANRRHLRDRLGAALADRRSLPSTALLLIDLDHFKEVNDTLGHSAGDQVLIEVANRLRGAAGDGLVARLGGDEFAVILDGHSAPARAEHDARQILEVLRDPMDLDGIRVSLRASAGLATANGSSSTEEMLRRADVAMYQAKDAGRALARYDRSRDTADPHRLALRGELPGAVSEHRFDIGFAPIVDLGSGAALGVDAVVRWGQPELGDQPATGMLALVERSGLLAEFTRSMVDRSLAAARVWQDAGFRLPVSVCVSARSLLDPAFPTEIRQRLAAHRIAADQLIIELTETGGANCPDLATRALDQLHDDGVRIAFAGFGTSDVSLAALLRIPVHLVKIDHPALAASGNSPAALPSLVGLGRDLANLVVATGVATTGQRRLLWEMGCTAGQGRLFWPGAAGLTDVLDTLRKGRDGVAGTLAPSLHSGANVVRMPRLRRVSSG
ncbi:EAL domain-containing protein [Solwaraspora sp. WMMD406]|uniref:putative bifunctional diguanylate cyclase/phosphodiesterase n=1 Tax=Solwaraspora sp. WMMD406 TaxID=3016095 RepID=UPI002415EB8F|nr:EAL domain-containing protein [Solwaraspora sp. WMMD406]MDG4766303.1 EAL domain-containing protein [Solwaraspora sp. WMMD406]